MQGWKSEISVCQKRDQERRRDYHIIFVFQDGTCTSSAVFHGSLQKSYSKAQSIGFLKTTIRNSLGISVLPPHEIMLIPELFVGEQGRETAYVACMDRGKRTLWMLQVLERVMNS